MEPLEHRTIAKVSARLVPFLIVCYFVAYLDRVNVGFAALTMNKDLGLSASAFGFGAGIFFLAYFLFEVPSNLFLERVGARKWIARIMFTWGLVSGGMAFVGGETSFYVVRVLLGIAEAGFFPGIIFYLTLWFPAVYRARIIGYFMAAIPLSTVIGAPVSGLLLGLDGFMGMKGWQWLFILEAVPALILSVVVFFYLTDRPADATWLEPEERAWLVRRLDAGASAAGDGAPLQRDAGAAEPEGPGAQPRLFRRGRDQLRPELLPAADRQGVRRVERPGRAGVGAAVCGRAGQHRVVGTPLRSQAGAPVPSRVSAVRGVRRHRDFHRARRSDDEDAGVVHRGLWHLRLPAGVLDVSDGVPLRRRGGRRDRADQLDWQPGRLRRSIRHGPASRMDRQLHRRACCRSRRPASSR